MSQLKRTGVGVTSKLGRSNGYLQHDTGIVGALAMPEPATRCDDGYQLPTNTQNPNPYRLGFFCLERQCWRGFRVLPS
jgi:hypothetical protein